MNDEAGPLVPAPRSVDSPVERSLSRISNTESDVLSTTFRPEWKTKLCFFLVLLTETLERTAFYGLICNMVLFLNSETLNWTSYNAVDAILLLNGISYVMAIFGGWIADACLGKFHTVILFFLIYIAGYSFWPFFYYPPEAPDYPPKWCSLQNKSGSSNGLGRVEGLLGLGVTDSTVSWAQENCSWVVFLSIAIVSVGYGCVRANIIPFGAQQFEHEGRTAMRVYFNWFYWAINVGAFVAYGGMGYIQQERNYFYGYLAPFCVLILAFLIFLSGYCVFALKSATGSVMTRLVSMCWESVAVCCKTRRSRDVEILNTDLELSRERAPCCLDYASVRYGGTFSDSDVTDVKQLLKIVVVFLSMVPYWTVYYQMQTTFVVQGLHMQLDFSNNDTMEAARDRKFTIPAAWLSLFNVLVVLILLPILDRFIYPYLDKRGLSPSLSTRIVIGMSLAVLSMCSAGVIEYVRLERYWVNGTYPTIHYQRIGNSTYYKAAKMSVLYQLPQYSFIGISELFASIGGLELAYIYAPRSMQGIIMGLYWFSQGLGSFLGTALMQGFKSVWFTSWDHGDINCKTSPFIEPRSPCRLDHYFYFLAGVQVVGLLMFVVLTRLLEVGSSIPLRVQEDGHTVVRPHDSSPDSIQSSLQRSNEHNLSFT